MYYGAIKNCDIANGPGVRVSLFVSGCTHRCPGCFNEVAWDFKYGKPFTDDTVNEILQLLKPDHIQGITVLGGEPFDPHNQASVVSLLKKIKEVYPQKTIWVFTGYLLDRDILAGKVGDWNITSEYIRYIDVLVDGPFIQEKKNLSLRFRGSENQRIIDVQASLRENSIVLWQDWQGSERGLKK